MPRKDFNKFIKLGQAYLPSELFIQTYETDPECPFNYAKIRKSDTTFIETSGRNLNINKGIFIDVFPLDNYPQGKIKSSLVQFVNKVYLIAIGRKFFQDTKTLK